MSGHERSGHERSGSESFHQRMILLVVAGGIAAYKIPDLLRRLRDRHTRVRCVLTRAGERFVTPLTLASLSGEKVYGDLFSLTDEAEMGHIRLAREADVIVVAPATADLMAKMAAGLADDLASTLLLATNSPILLAPSMNTTMWQHPATQHNLAVLKRRGVTVVGPDSGSLACGETGMGRMAEVPDILEAIDRTMMACTGNGPLRGRRALVTSGPTHEPIDPVRFIANRSSGRQGHAIAEALARQGAEVTLVSGPTSLAPPPGVRLVSVGTAREMLSACLEALPVDIAVCAAAVADWRVAAVENKIKKTADGKVPTLTLIPNPDILATLSAPGPDRPSLVVGFAAETQSVPVLARQKLDRKGCDWICANDVSPETGTFGGDRNRIHLITRETAEHWPSLLKVEVARRLVERIVERLMATLSSPSS